MSSWSMLRNLISKHEIYIKLSYICDILGEYYADVSFRQGRSAQACRPILARDVVAAFDLIILI